jgi:hypothetical protein
LAGEGVYRFLLRMPDELRVRLHESAQAEGRSLNSEIVQRLEESVATPAVGSSRLADGSARRGGSMRHWNRRVAIAALLALAAVVGVVVGGRLSGDSPSASPIAKLALGGKELQWSSPGGVANGGTGGESAELMAAMQQYDSARIAPGTVVAGGAYSAAFSSLTSLAASGGTWSEITRVPYDADDPDYRDYYSNSSGGSGLVTGRITGLAVADGGIVFAAGADGGVWRSTNGAGNWQPIADGLPSQSSGDLAIGPDKALWYATGEANTGGTSYVGSGVYRLTNTASGLFAPADRVGGTELESTTIYHVRFAGDTAYAATIRGLWSRSVSGPNSEPWKLLFAPQPEFLPGGSKAGQQNAADQNYVNDVAIDPRNARHIVVAAGWRAGAPYNGFYESKDGGATWAKINPGGAINPKDIGYANFAYSADGSKLYVINESVTLYNQATGTKASNTILDGIYVSNTGNPAGPWNRIADSTKLAANGSPLKQAVGGKGYGPGVQAWYNQFLIVDPSDPNHVYAGLEEVYETKNGGANWNVAGPYWNFYFSCWNVDTLYPPNGPSGGNGCPLSTHSDQHSVAIGNVGGKSYLYVGNDGGVYRRPVNGTENANGNATDWQSLNDGSIDALQYYYVGVGRLQADDAKRPDLQSGDSVLVSGGLQDNGGSLVRPGSGKMVSNFGGDGGDVIVDPNDGCNIAQEYVYMTIRVTKTCANPTTTQAWLDLSLATTVDVSPPDVNAQFIAPFTANEQNVKQWLAAGNSIWYQDRGFDITSGSQWQKVYTLSTPDKTFTAITYSGNRAIATWCGPCTNGSATVPFQRGAVVGTFANGSWTWTPVAFAADFPNRQILGAAIDPNNQDHLVLGINGFSRRYTEGPGAGVGHVYESKDGGRTWVGIDGNFPDIPATDVLILKSGGIVVGTDLGVLYRAAGSTTWTRLGGSSLPVTTAMDLHLGPDGNIYVATHGRGIWRIAGSKL